MKETLYWVYISQIFGAGNHRIWKLLNECEDVEEGYKKISEGIFQLNSSESQIFSKISLDTAADTIRCCRENDIYICTYEDKYYPSRLKTIYDPPAVLYVSGDVKCLESDVSVSVVGTRHPSGYGIEAAGKISEELAKAGITIVSGFAAGIDSAAHRGALIGGGRTIAVLGCGTNVDYPKSNSDIRDAVKKNGAFISEFPPGTPPLGRNFPLRNRLISGLSLGVFVAEAPMGSGALITADMAIEQGRDVFCLPPCDIFSRSFQGVVKYLRDGAIPVFSHLDILYEYYTTFSHKLSSMKPENEYISAHTDSMLFREPEENRKKKPETQAPDHEGSTAQTKPIFYEDMTEVQKSIADCLLSGQMHIDDICSLTGMDMPDLLTELTELEISGAVTSLPGKIYKIN